MSKRRLLAAKLSAVLGGTSLAIGLCLPRATAQATTFTNALYSGRYICAESAFQNFFTATVRINPNGAGAYNSGTLVAPIDPSVPFNPALPPANNFCTYTLGVGSAYVVATDGTGTEVLSWNAAAGNPAGCPVPFGSFVMTDAIALRGNITNGVVINLRLTSDNLLDRNLGGEGQCFQ